MTTAKMMGPGASKILGYCLHPGWRSGPHLSSQFARQISTANKRREAPPGWVAPRPI